MLTLSFHSFSRLSILALFLFFNILGCTDSSGSRSNTDSIVVKTEKLHLEDIDRTLRATGTLFAEEEITISAKVAGRVKEVLHDLGDEVRIGQPLLKIEDVDYVLARNARLEAANEALARLGLKELPTKELQFSSLPSVERARLNAENTKSRFTRAKTLFERKPPLMSEQEFSNVKTEYEIARNDHQLAIFNARSLLAQASNLYAQYEQADQLVKDTVHEVPSGKRPPLSSNSPAEDMSGRYFVAGREVSVGNYVSIAQPLFRLIDPDNLKLRVQIPERFTGKIKLGQQVSLKTESHTENSKGNISRISPIINVQSRTRETEVAVPNTDQKLLAGMFATALINVGAEKVLLVPQDSIRSFAGINKVLVVEDGKVSEKQVQLGSQQNEKIEITEGLKENEIIILNPAITLTTGMNVSTEDQIQE